MANRGGKQAEKHHGNKETGAVLERARRAREL
jgi:hypothetical protein